MVSRTHILRPLLLLASVVIALIVAPAASAKGKDRNHDGLPDRWERQYGLSLKVNQANKDPDRDGLKNRAEFKAATDPTLDDSDDDGIEDGEENAGVVKSFDGDTLVIKLFTGGKVVGTVDDETDVSCDDPAGYEDERQNGGSASAAKRSPHGPQDGQSDDPPDEDVPDDSGDCGPDDIEAGVIVHSAELSDGPGSAFDEVDLVL